MSGKRILLSLPVAEGNCTHVNVEVFYSKGGMNYFTGVNERRGYYLSVVPISKSANTTSFTAFSGVKQFVKEAGRYSSKYLNEFVVDYEMMNSMVEHVLEKNKIKLNLPSKESESIGTDEIKLSTVCE